MARPRRPMATYPLANSPAANSNYSRRATLLIIYLVFCYHHVVLFYILSILSASSATRINLPTPTNAVSTPPHATKSHLLPMQHLATPSPVNARHQKQSPTNATPRKAVPSRRTPPKAVSHRRNAKHRRPTPTRASSSRPQPTHAT
jgi:hypothetical protein